MGSEMCIRDSLYEARYRQQASPSPLLPCSSDASIRWAGSMVCDSAMSAMARATLESRTIPRPVRCFLLAISRRAVFPSLLRACEAIAASILVSPSWPSPSLRLATLHERNSRPRITSSSNSELVFPSAPRTIRSGSGRATSTIKSIRSASGPPSFVRYRSIAASEQRQAISRSPRYPHGQGLLAAMS